MAGDRFRSERSYKPLLLILFLIPAVFVALGVFRVGGSPTISIEPGMPAIGKRTPFGRVKRRQHLSIRHIHRAPSFFSGAPKPTETY
jgi:hypothetical protein